MSYIPYTVYKHCNYDFLNDITKVQVMAGQCTGCKQGSKFWIRAMRLTTDQGSIFECYSHSQNFDQYGTLYTFDAQQQVFNGAIRLTGITAYLDGTDDNCILGHVFFHFSYFTNEPTYEPSTLPSGIPSLQPTITPSRRPTKHPTKYPTVPPTKC